MALEPYLLQDVIVGEGTPPLRYNGEMDEALKKALIYDRDSGKWYLKVMGGDFVEVPVDENGIPTYNVPEYITPKRAADGN